MQTIEELVTDIRRDMVAGRTHIKFRKDIIVPSIEEAQKEQKCKTVKAHSVVNDVLATKSGLTTGTEHLEATELQPEQRESE